MIDRPFRTHNVLKLSIILFMQHNESVHVPFYHFHL